MADAWNAISASPPSCARQPDGCLLSHLASTDSLLILRFRLWLMSRPFHAWEVAVCISNNNHDPVLSSLYDVQSAINVLFHMFHFVYCICAWRVVSAHCECFVIKITLRDSNNLLFNNIRDYIPDIFNAILILFTFVAANPWTSTLQILQTHYIYLAHDIRT